MIGAEVGTCKQPLEVKSCAAIDVREKVKILPPLRGGE